MAIDISSSVANDEEARADVDVLNSRLEKTSQLTKKIQASLLGLDTTSSSITQAVGPIYGNTRKLKDVDIHVENAISAIERVRQPSDIRSNEEEIIRRGPEKVGLNAYLTSLKRVNKAHRDMNQTSLRSNMQAMSELGRLLESGRVQLKTHFQRILQEDSTPIEPLLYITKDKPFPGFSQDKLTRLGLINQNISSSQPGKSLESPLIQAYASVRGPYLTSTLQNLASATVNTTKKMTPDAVYRQGTNGLGTYVKGMEGAFLAEYDNICALFMRDQWSKAFNLTCQGAISELSRTLRELNTHIKAFLATDCYLAYEVVEIMSNLSSTLETRTGELKPSFAAALKPVRETAKASLGELLEDTRRRITNIAALSPDGAATPLTAETMTRLQTMVEFLRPISSIMISIGDGGWKSSAAAYNSTDQIPSLNSFDVSADGKQIFSNYCLDTVDTLLTGLEAKAKLLLKGKAILGVFIANNATVVDRMIRTSDLQPFMTKCMPDIDKWRKSGASLYTAAWREPSAHLLDVQYTNRASTRPVSGSTVSVDSGAILKGLSSKDKDAIKEKFRLFNASFDELVAKHKSLAMEREVRDILAKQVQQMIEPLYGRFWDRYHEVDKGKGKYVKYDKGNMSAVFMSLA